MTMHEHRYLKNKKFCPICDHSHFPDSDPKTGGVCLKEPPRPLFQGYQQAAAVLANLPAPPPQPVVGSWYPQLLRESTCSHHTPRIMGEG